MFSEQNIFSRESFREKPSVLYHASSRSDIEEFEPRAEKTRDPNEGPVVFASPDKASVTRFLVPTNDSWTQISSFHKVHTIIISDEARFRALDKGGTVYALSSDTFNLTDEKHHPDEWTSRKAVRPKEKIEYPSALEAMLDQSVQVFFVNAEILKKIRESQDHGLSILRTLQSENQKRGKNHISLP